jgi:hypothetical protein
LDLFVQIIKEEQLLAASPWAYCRIELPRASTFKLAARRNGFSQLEELLCPSCHEHYFLACEKRIRKKSGKEIVYDYHTVELLYADDFMYLIFDNDEAAMTFIHEHGITIDYSALQKQQEAIAIQMESLNKIAKSLEEKKP